MKTCKFKKKFKRYGIKKSFLIFLRKFFLEPSGLINLYNNYYSKNQQRFTPGTSKWLVSTEIKYGGFAKEDHHRGGDRMSVWYHGYSPVYEKALFPFLNKEDITIVEVGILKGTGLAIWSDLFGKGRVIGLDVNLDYIKKNMDNLKRKGAFRNKNIELYEFDQFKDNKAFFNKILGKDKVDIFIDDGCHKKEAIIKTMQDVLPYLAKNFVYIIEDNNMIHLKIREIYPNLRVKNFEQITEITSL